jgi:hypothetical protein
VQNNVANHEHIEPKTQTNYLMPQEFSETEGDALDALDTIQINGSQLYSTFPNLDHNCEGVVSSFVISQEVFKEALLHLLNEYYQELSKGKRRDLASRSSKAQDSYIVRTCGATSKLHILEKSEAPPRVGMWIFQSILEQRDLIIQW